MAARPSELVSEIFDHCHDTIARLLRIDSARDHDEKDWKELEKSESEKSESEPSSTRMPLITLMRNVGRLPKPAVRLRRKLRLLHRPLVIR
jgi:hypothetical protein